MCNSQPSVSTLIVPLTPSSVADAASSASTNQSATNIATLAQVYPETTVKLNSIFRKSGNASMHYNGSFEASRAVPNVYIDGVTLTPTSDMEKSSDDVRTELDSHASKVSLGSNSFVFESIGRNSNVQPFNNDLGIAKNVPIFDGTLERDFPCTGGVYV